MINKAGDERAARLKLRPLKKALKRDYEDYPIFQREPDIDDIYVIGEHSIFDRSNSKNEGM